MLEKSVARLLSPVGYAVIGAVVGAAALPVVRRGLRRAAVWTVRGVLAVQDQAKKVAAGAKSEWQGLVSEARAES
ncbi:hypothetical protein [Desulfothermobacter acidiphilus]|uniref:hypothetical protein n=1 Tax=Desulfothermobacter acidiphilus TaxID=1938353 RepID=UPI003F8B1111